MGLDCSKPAPVDPPTKQQSDPLPFLRHSATTVSEIRITPGQFIKVNSGSYLKDYKMKRLLGEGGFGKVYEVEHKVSKMERAVKEIMKSKGNSDVDREKFIAEVSILAKLDHPNIMKIFELYEDAHKFYVVSELIRGGELFDYLTKQESLTEVFAANIMKQVLSAVNYLHKQGIVHRDLKPENVMLEQEPNSVEELNLKLIDFGTSVSVPESGRLREAIGTMYYMAPEVLDRRYDSKCDVWSLGVILFVLMAGYPPFGGESDDEIVGNIVKNAPAYDTPQWWAASPEVRNFVRRMLTSDPRQRPTAQECLNDPWILKFCQARVGEAERAVAVSGLRSFRGDVKLQQAVSTFITTQLLTKEETNHWRDVFNSIDTNGDGHLSREEMIEGLSKTMSQEEAVAEVEAIMQQVDTDQSGHIDYTEFLNASASLGKQMSTSVLEKAFKMIDEDGSGKIGINELKNLLGKGVIADESVWNGLLQQADKDGDGEIDIKEFTALMLQTYS
jgi:calcium-dependent protein kinase